MFFYKGLMMAHTAGRNYLIDNIHSQNSDLCVIENFITHLSNTTATTGWLH